MAETTGNLTWVEVSTDNVTFSPICVYGNEAKVDYGKSSVKKEFCLSSNDAVVTTGNREFSEHSYNHLWLEGDGSAGNKIIKDAHLADALEDKKIYIRVTANNTQGTNGTQYTARFLVSSYAHLFKKEEVVKTEWACEQLDLPVEVASA